jgi:hypothetical protein
MSYQNNENWLGQPFIYNENQHQSTTGLSSVASQDLSLSTAAPIVNFGLQGELITQSFIYADSINVVDVHGLQEHGSPPSLFPFRDSYPFQTPIPQRGLTPGTPAQLVTPNSAYNTHNMLPFTPHSPTPHLAHNSPQNLAYRPFYPSQNAQNSLIATPEMRVPLNTPNPFEKTQNPAPNIHNLTRNAPSLLQSAQRAVVSDQGLGTNEPTETSKGMGQGREKNVEDADEVEIMEDMEEKKGKGTTQEKGQGRVRDVEDRDEVEVMDETEGKKLKGKGNRRGRKETGAKGGKEAAKEENQEVVKKGKGKEVTEKEAKKESGKSKKESTKGKKGAGGRSGENARENDGVSDEEISTLPQEDQDEITDLPSGYDQVNWSDDDKLLVINYICKDVQTYNNFIINQKDAFLQVLIIRPCRINDY